MVQFRFIVSNFIPRIGSTLMEDDLEINELLNSIPEGVDKENFKAALEGLKGEPDELLSLTARAYLMADEMGLYRPETEKISALRTGDTIDVEGTIVRVDPVKHFTRKDGGEGSLISLQIDDGSGRCRLTIFDWKLIDRIVSGEFLEGDRVRLMCVTPEDRGYGLELKFRKGSQILSLEDREADDDDGTGGKGDEEGALEEIQGIVVSISEPVTAFTPEVPSGGEYIRVMVHDGKTTHSVLLPVDMDRQVEKLKMEERLKITSVTRTRSGDLAAGKGSQLIHFM